LAIDDAYALYLSILTYFPTTSTTAPSPETIQQALQLYEDTRRPHAVRLLEVVHTNNEMKTKKIKAETQETDAELRARAKRGSGTTWLHEHDVERAFEEARARAGKGKVGEGE
jgi:salicylate hydroxylase